MSRQFISAPAQPLRGTVSVPGDKSISHRALMLGALAEGTTQISGFLAGEDCLATLAAIRAMGIQADVNGQGEVQITGRGLHGLTAPAAPLDMGNSGTAMRLFAGLLSAQAFDSVLSGDESLSRRPMERVAEPLRRMGAQIETTDGHAPLRITGGQRLTGTDHRLPVASAQLKSALLLAGLYAHGCTSVTEPAVTRDHTERMLVQFGVDVQRDGATVRICGDARLQATQIDVPGDLSSAAFFLLAGCIVPGSELTIDNVGLNPTRTGVLQILELMGADLQIDKRSSGAEPVGRITVRSRPLHGIDIPPELVPLAIDEFPLLFVAAAFAKGTTRISGAAELRHKESDRIGVMVAGLQQLGVQVKERPDGAEIIGGPVGGGSVDSHGDHRVAMAFAIAGAAASAPVQIADTDNVA
ncbi:MAG TPA: 3-phosphoshikimate 1-carboxyvinyltransferase, partial [Chromatiales bacterium]|nr:3-phosphoshikimate 1-carboxyvinyltransferase [Chromatiales bacterium]